MAGDFFPRKDADFVAWSGNLRRLLVGSPETYGIDGQQAAAYAAVDDALQAAYRAATDPGTRTSCAVRSKNEARAEAERAARRMSKLVKGSASVGGAEKMALGINPRDPGGRHPAVRPPEAAPGVRLTIAGGWRVQVRLYDCEVMRRGRPRGATGAIVWTFVGESAPQDINSWRYGGMAGKQTRVLDFPSDLPPGTRVWVRARWTGHRGTLGPLSGPTGTRLPGDGVSTMRGLRPAA